VKKIPAARQVYPWPKSSYSRAAFFEGFAMTPGAVGGISGRKCSGCRRIGPTTTSRPPLDQADSPAGIYLRSTPSRSPLNSYGARRGNTR